MSISFYFFLNTETQNIEISNKNSGKLVYNPLLINLQKQISESEELPFSFNPKSNSVLMGNEELFEINQGSIKVKRRFS